LSPRCGRGAASRRRTVTIGAAAFPPAGTLVHRGLDGDATGANIITAPATESASAVGRVRPVARLAPVGGLELDASASHRMSDRLRA
jgi:hypothetical protein